LKYNQIKETLLREIEERKLAAGEQILSIAEIMERFQVSKVTAVRSVVELENEGVVRREHGRGTFVAAPSAAEERPLLRKSVAVIVPDMTNPFYAEVVGSLERRLREFNMPIELSSTDYQVGEEQRHVEFIVRERQVAGIAICSFPIPHELDERILGFPLVAVDCCPDVLVGRCNSVTSDNLQGGYLATSHLLELGHKRIGYINIPGANPERLMGYRQALREKNVPYEEELVRVMDPHQIVEGEVIEFVRAQRLTAIFAINDMTAAQCMQALRKAGYRTPADISIVGYDNINAAKLFEVPLTTVEQHEEEMGRKAADILLGLINAEGGESLPRARELVLLPRLIVRESTAPPPAGAMA
jgi:LacI family transcriptional regulator